MRESEFGGGTWAIKKKPRPCIDGLSTVGVVKELPKQWPLVAKTTTTCLSVPVEPSFRHLTTQSSFIKQYSHDWHEAKVERGTSEHFVIGVR